MAAAAATPLPPLLSRRWVRLCTDLHTHAVLDIVSRVEHALLERLGAEPGGCIPVSAEEMGRLLALPEVAANMIRSGGQAWPETLILSGALESSVWLPECATCAGKQAGCC